MCIAEKFRAGVFADFVTFAGKSDLVMDMDILTTLIEMYCGTPMNSVSSIDMNIRVDVPKKKSKAVKKRIDANFPRMPDIIAGKCMARTFNCGFQCTRKKCADSGDYCTRHMKSAIESNKNIPALGRIDQPRHMKRFDNGDDIGWKHFIGSGEVEDIAMGVGIIEEVALPSVSASSINGENESDIVLSDDEEGVSLEGDSEVIGVIEVPRMKSVSEIVEVVEEPVVEEVSEIVDEIITTIDFQENTLVASKMVLEVEPVVAAEKCRMSVPEFGKFPKGFFPRMGKYQGVSYRFLEENIHGQHPVEEVNLKTMLCELVGEWDGDDVIWCDDFDENRHSFGIVDEDQTEIIWA